VFGRTSVYLTRKVKLGDHLHAVRERMPKFVVKDVRERFTNPPGIPYLGHKREFGRVLKDLEVVGIQNVIISLPPLG